MCGIAGYMGPRNSVPQLLTIMERQLQRGYDSAGIAVVTRKSRLVCEKKEGKLIKLRESLEHNPIEGTLGIGHTRWATHGKPSDVNSHPHMSSQIALIHNGVIENYLELKEFLEKHGSVFLSETDTEVLPHLIAYEKRRGIPSEGASLFEEAVVRALSHVKGAYAIAVICEEFPDELIVACHGSPLHIGIGEGELYVASEIGALAGLVSNVTTLADSHLAVLHRGNGFIARGINGMTTMKHKIEPLAVSENAVGKGEFPHFMLKEIFGQRESLEDALRGRIIAETGAIKLGAFDNEVTKKAFRDTSRITVVACGTSLYSGMVFKHILESIVRIPVNVEFASEFIYSDPILDRNQVVIAISQSGETADTKAAVKLAKEQGAFIYGVTNGVTSTIARMVDAGTFLHVGPEISVASTKAFTAQCAVLTLVALRVASLRGSGHSADLAILAQNLAKIPKVIEDVLRVISPQMKALAQEIKLAKGVMFLGRGLGYPLAREGELKLKEVSYLHAEGHPAGEMKHGHIALVEKGVPIIALLLDDGLAPKVLSNLSEAVARGGMPIVFSTAGKECVQGLPYKVVQLPKVPAFLAPLVLALPLQLLAYEVGVAKGHDVDQPRNLAKSVTVE